MSLRTSKDLDILVSIDEMEKTEEILVSLGYEADHKFSKVLSDWKWKSHHISYLHPQKKIQIEVHWKLNSRFIQEPSFDELWNRKKASELTVYPIYLLGREDLFFYLSSHGARHAWFRLRWLKDIERLLGLEMDWAKLISVFKKYQSSQIGGQSLLLSAKLLQAQIPKEIDDLASMQQAEKTAQQSLLFIGSMFNFSPTPPKEMIKPYNNYLFSLKSLQEKWRYLLKLSYPTTDDALAFPLPEPLHFLYYPLRPLIWGWRRFKRFRYRSSM